MIDLTSIRVEFDTSLESASSVLADTVLKAEVEVTSRFPGPIRCDQVYVTVKLMKAPAEVDPKSTRSAAKKSVEMTVPVEVDKNEAGRPSNHTSSDTAMVPIRSQQHLKQDGSLSSVALVCPNVHQFLGYFNRRDCLL